MASFFIMKINYNSFKTQLNWRFNNCTFCFSDHWFCGFPFSSFAQNLLVFKKKRENMQYKSPYLQFFYEKSNVWIQVNSVKCIPAAELWHDLSLCLVHKGSTEVLVDDQQQFGWQVLRWKDALGPILIAIGKELNR